MEILQKPNSIKQQSSNYSNTISKKLSVRASRGSRGRKGSWGSEEIKNNNLLSSSASSASSASPNSAVISPAQLMVWEVGYE